jgi:hypothetical protein
VAAAESYVISINFDMAAWVVISSEPDLGFIKFIVLVALLSMLRELLDLLIGAFFGVVFLKVLVAGMVVLKKFA